MKNDAPVWFVVADCESARLLCGTPEPAGLLHVDEKARLVLTSTAETARRTTRLGLSGSAEPEGVEHDAKLVHFARLLADWLQRQLGLHQVGTCPLLAPARLLQALRREAPPDLLGRLVEQDCELADLTSLRLAQHPRVAALVAV